MPPRRNVQIPTRRSDRIRLREEARAAPVDAPVPPTSPVTPTAPGARAAPAIGGPVLQSPQPSPESPDARASSFRIQTSSVFQRVTSPPPVAGTSAAARAAIAVSMATGMMPSGSRPLTSTGCNERGAIQRIFREHQDFLKEKPEGCQVAMEKDNVFIWTATIKGPPGTPYEGGVFRLVMTFPSNYPFMPPSVFFRTKIYHCNIGTSGSICMDILSTEWSPALTVSKVLLSIISLLADPNPDDPLEQQSAALCKRNRAEYDEKARLWTSNYAIPDVDQQSPDSD